jgi:hypothetical protein
MGATKDLNLIDVVEMDIFYKILSQFLDNLFLKEGMDQLKSDLIYLD